MMEASRRSNQITIRSDLTGYAALLGEGLSSKVELLDRLLGNVHYPSIGQYKERLLAQAIKDFLPSTIEIGTGFVMFPHEDTDPPGGKQWHDPLNQSAFSMSRQCDILIYDIARFPPIFRDGTFVIVRPEAVRAVIEVKGSISIPTVREALDSFHDFGLKWRTTQLFYLDQHQSTTPAPGLFLMAWKIKQTSNGRPITSPRSIRQVVADFYASHVQLSEVEGYPFLRQLLIHNTAEIFTIGGAEMKDDKWVDHFGWRSDDGHFIRVDSNGKLFRDKDRTIASLLAALHWSIGREDFNRFFSYTDEVKDRQSLASEHFGTTWAWSDVPDTTKFAARVPKAPSDHTD